MNAIRLTWIAGCLLAAGMLPLQGADPVLRFPDGLSWKDVFDSGFRPKHLAGLSHKTCICMDQRFILEMSSTGKAFPLDAGRLTFKLQSDDSIGLFWHAGWTPITLKEGEQRLEAFRDWAGGGLKEKGRVPPVIDPRSGLVNAENEFYAAAEFGQYSVTYGFGVSFRKEAPLLPHLYISWRPAKGQRSLPVRTKVVEPPAGYEWYSLDPAIDTPEPGVRRPAKSPPRVAGKAGAAAADAEDRKQGMEATKQQAMAGANALWPWLLALAGVAVAGLVWWKRVRAR